MGRRRVLVLAPAITRMQCMSNPYKQIEEGDKGKGEEKESSTSAVVRRTRTSTGFWSSWRKKKAAAAAAKKKKGGARRRGFRVARLRIRVLSPFFWLKKLLDSYVNMMLAIERSAPSQDCSGMVTYPSYMYGGAAGAGAGAPWMFPTFSAPVVF